MRNRRDVVVKTEGRDFYSIYILRGRDETERTIVVGSASVNESAVKHQNYVCKLNRVSTGVFDRACYVLRITGYRGHKS